MNTPNAAALALVARLADALALLAQECNTNNDFADEHASEVEALAAAAEAESEARRFLKAAINEHGVETILAGSLDDWDGGNPDAPHNLRVELAETRLEVTLWPKAAGDEPAGAGVNVLLEVNHGRPAVHISLAGHDDTAVHLHVNPDSSLEVVTEDSNRWTSQASQVYPSSRAQVWKAH